jgi:ribosomal protein S18 acetylase RimI-like enzyme
VTSFAFRRAVAADGELVQRLSADAYEPYTALLGAQAVPAVEPYAPRIARGEVWLLEQDGEVVALAVLEPHPDHLMIFSLAVDPARHHRGLGRRLLDFAEQRARAEGVGELRLYTNAKMERNIALYARAGYHETGRRAHPRRAGWVLVDMAKTAPP